MDRAEAVKILKIQSGVTAVNTPSCIELHEALDLAIEALKGDTEEEVDYCSWDKTDCISRQQAIDVISNCKGICDCYDDVKTLIDNIPPVTPTERTGEWIPVSERLPEVGEYVLASVHDHCADYDIIINKYEEQAFWSEGRITAWQPLPESYRPEGEDK